MTEIVGQVSATRVQAEADQLTATIKSTVSQDKFVFWAGIDGTKNIADKPEYSNDKQSTAIGALKDKVLQNENTVAKYYPGVGTPGTQPLSSAFPYNQSEASARQIVSEYAYEANKWLTENPGKTGADLSLMMATFSRASVTGAMVSQILQQEGLVYKGTMLIPPGQATIAAALVISPVNTGSGPGNLAFVGVENFTEVIAANDYRSTYKQAVYDNAQKVYITGTHGDVGGFYDRGIGGIVTQAYTDYFNTLRNGMVDALPPERQYDGRPLVDVHAEPFNLAAPWNIAYGSFEEGTPLITVPTGTQPTIQRIENGDITTFVNYKGETITTTRIGGALASVVVTPPVSVTDYEIQPFNYSDKYGNSFRTKTGVDGNVLRDTHGEVICTVTYNSGSSITQCDVTETGKFLSASDSSTPSTGPTTDLFTQTVTTTSATLDTGGTDWDGLAASGGGWKVGAASDTLNINTDPFSALLGDALTGGIRPGNHNISDTGNRWDATANAFGRLDDLVRNAITDTPTGFYNLDLAALAAGNSFADKYVPADPLVLDLNGDGVKLTPFTEKTVLFDIDHDGGAKEQTGWVSAQDGVLAMDLNGNGRHLKSHANAEAANEGKWRLAV